jgi:hypothetical protein
MLQLFKEETKTKTEQEEATMNRQVYNHGSLLQDHTVTESQVLRTKQTKFCFAFWRQGLSAHPRLASNL